MELQLPGNDFDLMRKVQYSFLNLFNKRNCEDPDVAQVREYPRESGFSLLKKLRYKRRLSVMDEIEYDQRISKIGYAINSYVSCIKMDQLIKVAFLNGDDEFVGTCDMCGLKNDEMHETNCKGL